MPEFLIVKEPTANTQMADLCISIPQRSIVLSDQNEVDTSIFAAGSPDKLVLQDFQDPFRILLQTLERINIAWFIIIRFGFRDCVELPTGSSVRLLRESKSRNLGCSHLLDWLHWKAHYT